MKPKKYRYDAFLSHAVEDKMPIATELNIRLCKAGLTIWYSGSELTAGDSIRETINRGLAQSRYGIVILSPTYLSKGWALQEFYSFVNREEHGEKVIIPVLYDLTPKQLAEHHVEMVDRWAIDSRKGLDHVTHELVRAIRKGQEKDTEKQSEVRKSKLLWISAVVVFIGLVCFWWFVFIRVQPPSQAMVNEAIQHRIAVLQGQVVAARQLELQALSAVPNEAIIERYAMYMSFRSHFRNTYKFNDGRQEWQFKKNVNAVLGLDIDQLSPVNFYGFSSPQIYLNDSDVDTLRTIQYIYLNTEPVTYMTEEEWKDNTFLVHVHYAQPIRSVSATLTLPQTIEGTKRRELDLKGLLPAETFVFKYSNANWVLQE